MSSGAVWRRSRSRASLPGRARRRGRLCPLLVESRLPMKTSTAGVESLEKKIATPHPITPPASVALHRLFAVASSHLVSWRASYVTAIRQHQHRIGPSPTAASSRSARRIPRPTRTGLPRSGEGAQVSELAYGLWTTQPLAVAIAGRSRERQRIRKRFQVREGEPGPRVGAGLQSTVSAGPAVGTSSGRPWSSGSTSASTVAFVRVPRRVFQRLLPERRTPKRTTSNGPVREHRGGEARRRQLTEDGNVEISGRDLR